MNALRFALAVTPITIALALLGILLLVSTQPGDEEARRLDLALRQASELAPRIVSVSRSLAGGGSLVDPVAAIDELEAALARRFEAATGAFEALHAPRRGVLQEVRTIAQTVFDSIEREPRNVLGLAQLFAGIERDAGEFSVRIAAATAAFERWRRVDRQLTRDSRELVADLRAGGDAGSADRIFATTRQLRARLAGAVPFGSAEVEALVSELAVGSSASPDAPRLQRLQGTMRSLLLARRELISAVSSLEQAPLPERLAELRDAVSGDLVARLSTIGDARTLLNVYTALLLAVLVYFAVRLRGSHAALNRSYEVLEHRVEDRTRDLLRANEELKESQVQLVQAEKMSSLGQLVAGVMHEINTPLMYVRSNVETTAHSTSRLAEELAPASELAREVRREKRDRVAIKDGLRALGLTVDPEEVDISFEEIATLSADTLEGIDQITELVQSLKDFSRLDRADEDWFDVREGLERTLTITRNLLKYGVEVVRDFDEVPDIRCAPSRLNQVFINLVTNAAQAMEGQGRLELRTRTTGEAVEITVSDSGCGIPEAHLEKILDPFFTTKPVGEGTGLGLSIVRTIVEEHEGHLDVSSVVGEGTRFTVTLPIDRGAAAGQQREEAA